MLRHLERRHAESVDKVLRTFRAYVDKRRGVVKKGQTIRDELRQEVDAVLKGLRAQEKESQEDPKLTVEQERKAIRARLEAESRLRDTETVEQLRKLQREIRELRSLRDQPHRDAIANLERRLQAVSAEASALLRASSA